jgi:hypothetical protein
MFEGLKLNSEYLKSVFRQNIRTLAHYLYVLRGCKKGRAVENWLEAENKLKRCLDSDKDEPKAPGPGIST